MVLLHGVLQGEDFNRNCLEMTDLGVQVWLEKIDWESESYSLSSPTNAELQAGKVLLTWYF